jgi:3-oxoadipate CoA-transferase alpha subunit
MKPVYTDPAAAVADIPDGATVMVGGFSSVGVPAALLRALNARGVRGLTVIANGTSHNRDPNHPTSGLQAHMVARAILSFPVPPSPVPGNPFEEGYEKGTIALEIVPQGTLAERIRAGGAGIAAFYTPTGVGTPFAEGKEVREIGGRPCVLEYALTADFALVRALRADTMGNLVYRNAMRNFNPIMASAARVTIAQVEEVVDAGQLDPESVVTPGIFVHRLVVVPPADGR